MSAPLRIIASLVGLLLLIGAEAAAHPSPTSVARIDLTVDGARIEQDVPLVELESAYGARLFESGEPAAAALARNRDALLTYAGAHVSAHVDGAPWTVAVPGARAYDAEDGPRVVFDIRLRAPAGADGGLLELTDDIVTHEVVTHSLLVYLRSDWSAGPEGADGRLLGTLRGPVRTLTIEPAGGFAQGLVGVMHLGVEHITGGVDHLVFLFALLLVAPIAARDGRWDRARPTREALGALARVVTAFTVGHSLTLALSLLGGLDLPTAPVEAAIALSVLITAAHALRPLFPRHEAWVAGAFGLVHGLGLAGALAERDLGGAQAAWTLLGFNLGIELAQLALVLLVMPWILLLARTPAYRPTRQIGGVVAGVLALGWLGARIADLPDPTAPLVDGLVAHPLPLLATLAVGASLAWIYARRAASTGPVAPGC